MPGRKSQSAALPYRVDDAGESQILLVTTRRSGRWTIPKGNVKAGLLPHTSAAREAYEEAGIIGTIDFVPIGEFTLRKAAGGDEPKTDAIPVFALAVVSEMQIWPEMHDRRREWFSTAEAAARVGNDEIRDIIAQFAATAVER